MDAHHDNLSETHNSFHMQIQFWIEKHDMKMCILICNVKMKKNIRVLCRDNSLFKVTIL